MLPRDDMDIDVSSHIGLLQERWHQSVPLIRPRDVESILTSLWKTNGVELPPRWLVELLNSTGGMAEGSSTEDLFRLWDTDFILANGIHHYKSRPFLVFADQDIGVWFFAIALDGDPAVYSRGLDGKFTMFCASGEKFLDLLVKGLVYPQLFENYAAVERRLSS